MPELRFTVHKASKTSMERFRGTWQDTYESKSLKLVEQYTGLPWKHPELNITVIRSGSICKTFIAETDPQDPSKIRLVATKGKASLEALIHELVHANVWAACQNDSRFRETGLFEDIFGDEILATLIGQRISVSFQLRRRVDYRWALEYGLETAFDKIADILGFKLKTWNLGRDRRLSTGGAKRLHGEMVSDLENWFQGYMRRVRWKGTNMVEGRREIVKLFPNISERY